MTEEAFSPGLAGVVAAQTRLTGIDGEAGELIVAGFPLEELAPRASFDELVHLLWYDALPTADELRTLRRELAERRPLSATTMDLLRAAAARRLEIIDALRMAIGTLSLEADGGSDLVAAHRDAALLVAQCPTIVAAYARLLRGEEPVAPHPELSHAADYLYMLTGIAPTPEAVRALETYLNSAADHGLNASTFAARVIVSTQSDLISAITGAIGALKGPLHGGAPGPALDMVFEIGRTGEAEGYLRAKLERGERLMGFGHRIYKVRDPRADVLAGAIAPLYREGEQKEFYELALYVEKLALRLLEEYKPGRRLQTNVEFYTALLLHGLGLPSSLFTPTFAVARVAGWTAHCLEQLQDNRIFRPQSIYTGRRDRRWVPMESRLRRGG
jgi:citrate synthase